MPDRSSWLLSAPVAPVDFLECAPAPLGVVALDGERVWHRAANDRAAAWLGAPGEGQVALDVPEAAGQAWAAAARSCLACETSDPLVFDLQTDDGVRTLSVTLGALDVSLGLCAYAVEDVTHLRQTEQTLALLKAALDATTDSFVITDARLDPPGPHVVYVNAGFTAMTGFTEREMQDGTPRVLQGPKTDRTVLDRLRRRLTEDGRFHGETVNYRKDGVEFDLEWMVAPIRNEAGERTHYVSSQRDVTERRRLEHAFLETVSREQERIAQDLHDGVGQALTGVSYMLHGLRERFEAEGHAEGTRDLQRVAALLNDGLAQTRAIARGLFPVSLEREGFMLALDRLARRSAETYGITCKFAYEEPVLVTSVERANDLYQIAQEALANAVRHGQATVVLLALSTDEPAEVTLAVQDNGIGIPDDALERSPGIGIESMRARARRLGGSLTIGPVPDGGTAVRVRFPADLVGRGKAGPVAPV